MFIHSICINKPKIIIETFDLCIKTTQLLDACLGWSLKTENSKIPQILSAFTRVNPTFAINTAVRRSYAAAALFDLGELIMYHTI